MAAKEKSPYRRKHGSLFKTKHKSTGELKEIKFNDITVNHIDASDLLIFIGSERVRTLALTPMDAEALIEFLQNYVDLFGD